MVASVPNNKTLSIQNYVSGPFQASRPLGPPVENGIVSIAGTIQSGQTVTISGQGFTEKTNVAPYIFWDANDATLGNSGPAIGNPSTLSRQSDWNSRFWPAGSTIVNNLTAPGSSLAVRADYNGNEDPVMPLIDFGTGPQNSYHCRKYRDEFTTLDNYVFRLFLTADPGDRAGQTITQVGGNGATGTILRSGGSGNIQLRNDEGSVVSGTYFENGATVNFSGGGSGTVVASGNDPMDSTFNYKQWRLWESLTPPLNNNMIVTIDTVGGLPAARINTSAYFETSDATVLAGGSWNNEFDQVANKWLTEEICYKGGTLNQQDTVVDFYRTDPGVSKLLAWTPATRRWRSITTANPGHPAVIAHGQVSNGAMPSSLSYYDHIYHDDSLHRIMIGNAATWNACTQIEIQIPQNIWADDVIQFVLRQGSLSQLAGNYIYVFNDQGEVVNNAGFLIPSS